MNFCIIESYDIGRTQARFNFVYRSFSEAELTIEFDSCLFTELTSTLICRRKKVFHYNDSSGH